MMTMADQPIRVMLRFHGGVPFRQASDEAKAQYQAQLKQAFARWRSAGVKMIGSFRASGEGVGGYAHYILFDVDDLGTVHQMNSDIFGLGGIYQRHSFDVGLPPIVEGMWESA
jgi:muconolactone delta-isomerase